MLIKIRNLVHYATEAFEEMANCYRMAAHANALCAEAHEQAVKTSKLHEENAKLIIQLHEQMLETEKMRATRETMAAAYDAKVFAEASQ